MKPIPWIQSLALGLLLTSSAYALSELSGGKYVATLTPAVDERTADRIETQLKTIGELSMIDVKPRDSTVHFTVKDNSVVEYGRVKDAIKKAAPKVDVSDPAMEPAA
jgi:hypothetical protein